ncbi:hypothetical protein ACF0H5_016170 [Mactra antiquata]
MADIANHCCFAFILFIVVTTGLILQFIAALNFSTTDEFCGFNMSSNETEFENERAVVSEFRVLAWVGFAMEVLAFILLTARIKCCAKTFCVPCCDEHWECVFNIGNGWFLFSFITAVLDMVGMIKFQIENFSTSCVFSILAYRYAVANFIIVTLTVIIYIGIICKYGCPDSSKFLGSENEVADYHIDQTVTTHTEPDGRVWKSKSSSLVRN